MGLVLELGLEWCLGSQPWALPICYPGLPVLGVLPGGGDSEGVLKDVYELLGEERWEGHSRREQCARKHGSAWRLQSRAGQSGPL